MREKLTARIEELDKELKKVNCALELQTKKIAEYEINEMKLGFSMGGNMTEQTLEQGRLDAIKS